MRVPLWWSCRWFVSWSDDTAAVVTLAWRDRGDRVAEAHTSPVSVNVAAHCDIITLISAGSPFWVCSTNVLMMRADDPLKLVQNQGRRTNFATGLSLGTDLVSFLICESKGEQGTCAGKEESNATEHQNKDQGTEEPHTLGGDTVGDCGLVLGRSTVTAASGSRDHEAQPSLFPARCCPVGCA